MTLRIGNFSGFYGDRLDALHEMLTGGELDVLTGDFLAELTMLILGRDQLKDPGAGFARTFLRQLEDCLGLAHERGVRIVTNAGGLNPAGLADAVRELARRLGVPARVAHVEGDDLRGRFPDALAAHAYLGGSGIAACLREGADIVVTGRVTDAALVTGPAAAHFGWGPGEYDRLAGAVVAGHILECGTQATGGNYAFFQEADVRRPGFPVAELHADGSCVITKHPGTGGLVDVGTVTAQLLYETGGARYAGPDVTARLDSVVLESDGPDRVRVTGVRGEAPPPDLKVGLSRIGGFRNEVAFVLTGLDIEAKAALVREQMETYAFGKSRPAEVRWDLVRSDRADAGTEEEASAVLRLVVRDQQEETVGRALSGAAVELALGSYPGFHVLAPPGRGAPYGVFEAAYLPQGDVEHRAVLDDGRRIAVPPPTRTTALEPVPEPPLPDPLPPSQVLVRVPLGTIAGARSGDKGGDANVGVWVRTDEAWRWLAHELTVDRFRELLPETRALPVTRHVLPGLRAVNFVVEGILGAGVASQHRFDPQAKALGEWLRARYVDVPEGVAEGVPRAGATGEGLACGGGAVAVLHAGPASSGAAAVTVPAGPAPGGGTATGVPGGFTPGRGVVAARPGARAPARGAGAVDAGDLAPACTARASGAGAAGDPVLARTAAPAGPGSEGPARTTRQAAPAVPGPLPAAVTAAPARETAAPGGSPRAAVGLSEQAVSERPRAPAAGTRDVLVPVAVPERAQVSPEASAPAAAPPGPVCPAVAASGAPPLLRGASRALCVASDGPQAPQEASSGRPPSPSGSAGPSRPAGTETPPPEPASAPHVPSGAGTEPLTPVEATP